MVINFTKVFVTILIIAFFGMVLKHYFSKKNIDLVKNNRKNYETNILNQMIELPFLPNDTKDVIEFNSGFEKTDNQNFKRNFWELFK